MAFSESLRMLSGFWNTEDGCRWQHYADTSLTLILCHPLSLFLNSQSFWKNMPFTLSPPACSITKIWYLKVFPSPFCYIVVLPSPLLFREVLHRPVYLEPAYLPAAIARYYQKPSENMTPSLTPLCDLLNFQEKARLLCFLYKFFSNVFPIQCSEKTGLRVLQCPQMVRPHTSVNADSLHQVP